MPFAATWMDLKIILLQGKEDNPVASGSMDETWGHDAKWNKLVIKRWKLYALTYMKYLE